VEILAATEALRIGQRFGLEGGVLVEIGEGLSAVGPHVGTILRQQVLTRQFDNGLALGHLLKGLVTASSVAKTCGVERCCWLPLAMLGLRPKLASAQAPTSRR